MKPFERVFLPSCFIAGWGILIGITAGAVNVNGSGTSLHLVTTDLSFSAAQTNGAGARVLFVGTPVAGIASTNTFGAKVIIEPMMVITGNGMPVADFSATPLTGSAPFEVQFMDQSSGRLYEILSWTWDFGDGSPYSSDQDPVHTYDTPGTYTVSLTILTAGGPAYTARVNYIAVVQAVPALGGSGLVLLITAMAAGSMVLLRKKRMRVSGDKD